MAIEQYFKVKEGKKGKYILLCRTTRRSANKWLLHGRNWQFEENVFMSSFILQHLLNVCSTSKAS